MKTTGVRFRKISADEIYSLANCLLIGSLVLGVIATGAVVVSGNIKERQLKQELSKTNERAAIAEQRAAEANLKAEEEGLARVKLEERVAWRRLTIDQQSEIGSRLGRFSGQLAAVWYNAGDHEGGVIASDIAAVLHLANWNVFAPASMLQLAQAGRRGPTIIPTGVVIASTQDKTSRDATEALVNELLNFGFDAIKWPKIESNPTPTVFVTVEVRPEGAQGRAKLESHHK